MAIVADRDMLIARYRQPLSEDEFNFRRSQNGTSGACRSSLLFYTGKAMKYDVGIIGGGAIGLSCAWRLAQAGVRVGVFERGEIGREASWAAAGMLAAQCEAAHHPPAGAQSILDARHAMFDLCLQSRALYPAFAQELFEASSIDIELSLRSAPAALSSAEEWREPGILYVQRQPDEWAQNAFAQQNEAGHIVQSAPDFAGHNALWLPDEGQVNNRRLVEALRLACERSGVLIHQAEPVQEVHRRDGRAATIETPGHSALCDKVLLCAGAWSHDTLRLPPECLPPVRPLAGEMIAVQAGRIVDRVIYSDGVYMVPRRNGTLLNGATMEERGFDKSKSEATRTHLLQSACGMVPELAHCEIVEHWAGLRPASVDGLPILGATPVPNFYVATGHGRNGILLTPITAHLLVESILSSAGRKNTKVASEFSIERFVLPAEVETTPPRKESCLSKTI
ncbi:MAG: glycine oxidase [Abditibacteriota bacterium]|nr:glycine oxidase [Abditibacteriota bacterium]